MILRFLLLLVLVGIAVSSAPPTFATQEARGWGSSWTTPHSEQEKIGQEISARLSKAIRAQNWAAIDKALDDAQRAGLKSSNLHAMRAIVAIARRRYSEAVDFCDKALALLSTKDQPETASNLLTLRASAHVFENEERAARVDLERAIALDKSNLLAQNNYAWLLATCPDATVRDGKRAVKFARAANGHREKDNPILLDTLAAAEAEAGDFSAAVKDEKRAITLVKGDHAIYERHLQSYLNKAPVRESIETRRADFGMRFSENE